MVTKEYLAREAVRIEQDVIREEVGSQDQIWAAYGGFNRIDFKSDAFHVSPVIVPRSRVRELVDHLVLYFSGFQREAASIARQKIANIEARRSQLHRILETVDHAQAIICDERRSIVELGELLHESWLLKRELATAVSSSAIDDLYQAGREAGAIGGKLLGAGGGGFMLFFVPPDRRAALRARLSQLIAVDIDVDEHGSSVVVFQPNGLQPHNRTVSLSPGVAAAELSGRRAS
jgi:D-glycero-alpha-D-manno-heptose-7-phosphate kinase